MQQNLTDIKIPYKFHMLFYVVFHFLLDERMKALFKSLSKKKKKGK